MYVYLAGSIFYEGDKLRNRLWAERIRAAIPGIELYSPIENTEINDKTKCADSIAIANGDNARLDRTDVLIACIDGDVIPSGTSAEIGKFHEKIVGNAYATRPKFILGIGTDSREMCSTNNGEKIKAGCSGLFENQFSYQNLYTIGLIKQGGALVRTIDEAIKFLKELADTAYADDFAHAL